MPKQITQGIIRQIKQLSEETIKEAVKQPSEMTGLALEQLGLTSAGVGKAKLSQMEAEDKAKKEKQTARLKKSLEEEIKKRRLEREEQLRQQRQPAMPEEKIETEQALVIPASPKRQPGFLGLGQRRQVETAQQKAQPEKVARRIGG